MASRTENSIRNIKYAATGQVIGLLINFITRMVFVRTLSVEYLGINGLFSNILSILSLVELGVGSSIVYSLYKPLAEKDEQKIIALMSIFKKAYITIGIIVAVVGLSLTPFLSVFVREMPDISNIKVIYILVVINSAIGYFFSYKQSLISADQKDYIVMIYKYVFQFIFNVLQIIFLLVTHEYIIYLLLQVVNSLVWNLLVSRKASKLYPFLKNAKSNGLEGEERAALVRNMKAMILHKVGDIVINGTGNLLLAKLVNVVIVGLYSNYLMIISGLQMLFSLLFRSITASVGNLGATSSSDKVSSQFYVINFTGFWIYGFSSICLAILLNPFINLWLGDGYTLSTELVLLVVLNFYLNGMRTSVLTFRDTLGLFWYDRYKPLFEVIINLVFSIGLGLKFGAVGVFLGTTISTISTCFWFEPYIVFKYGFKSSVRPYFKMYGIYTLVCLFALIVTKYLSAMIIIEGIVGFILLSIVCFFTVNIIFLISFYRTREFKYLYKKFLSGFLLSVKRKVGERTRIN